MMLGAYPLGAAPLAGGASPASGGASPQSIDVARIDIPVSLYSPSISLGALAINADRIDVAASLFTPSIGLGALAISVARIDAPAQVLTPSITLGALSIAVSRIDLTPSLFAPSITLGTLAISADRINIATSLPSPTISLGSLSIAVSRIDTAATVYQPSVTLGALTISVGRIDLQSTVFAPTIGLGTLSISVPRIDAAITVYTPSVSGISIEVGVERINISVGLFSPEVTHVIDIPVSGSFTNMKTAFLRAKIKSKTGNPVTLRWTEWPSGEPTIDPTTGALVADEDNPAVTKECLTRGWVHYVSETDGRIRVHTEVQTGDCILEMAVPLIRVATSGDSGLVAGNVVDQWAFNRANRAVSSGGTKATGSEIQIESLKSLVFIIDDEEWTQPQISDNLKKSWNAIVCGIKISRSILLRRA